MIAFDKPAAMGKIVTAAQAMVDAIVAGAIAKAPAELWGRPGGCPTQAEAHDIWARILGCWGERIIETARIPTDEEAIQEQVFDCLHSFSLALSFSLPLSPAPSPSFSAWHTSSNFLPCFFPPLLTSHALIYISQILA
jgi:hypothetical protein